MGLFASLVRSSVTSSPLPGEYITGNKYGYGVCMCEGYPWLRPRPMQQPCLLIQWYTCSGVASVPIRLLAICFMHHQQQAEGKPYAYASGEHVEDSENESSESRSWSTDSHEKLAL